jgi:hypothetical protein
MDDCSSAGVPRRGGHLDSSGYIGMSLGCGNAPQAWADLEQAL